RPGGDSYSIKEGRTSKSARCTGAETKTVVVCTIICRHVQESRDRRGIGRDWAILRKGIDKLMKNAKKASKKAAPPKRRMCAAMEVHNRLLELYPSYRTAQAALASATSARMLTAAVAQPAGGVVKIPVVVHVVFNTASENISDAQVKSQIVALNKD